MSTRSSPSTPPPAKGSVPSRAVAVGGLLGILAVGLVALNLRPGATSVGPLMEDIVGAYGKGAIASGLLTALPPLAFGILGFFAVPISRRVGLTGTVVASFVLVTVGLLLRPAAGGFGAFVALSLLVLVGPALGNVVVPAWIKQHGGSRTVGWMTLYSVVLAVGGSAGAALAVPLAGSATDGWRDSLQFWGLLAVLPVVVWAVVLTRTGHDFPPAPPSGDLPGSLLRSRTAIALTIMFGLQSTNAYTQFGMLPQILTSSGLTPERAGVTVAVVSGWGIVGGLVMPTVIARFRQLPWLVGGFGLLTTAGYLGFWLAPEVSPLLWACILGIGGFAFPTAIALIPARSRSPRVTARLSGMAQPFGYVLAAIGPLVAGALLDSTGSIPVVLGFMALTGLALAVFGYRAALPRTVDDELTA
ncbi:MAG: MFS transporter [Brachybacterium sp.]|uniref:MFS transporter n=1 Tax=Brachybacterium sp. TaxID=1891286 RepID=UPI0026478751|nr:MFS transporter [Brachybacterium sp.]MDN5686736.1 MFS transporter [Brachybacterium sp.]